MITAGALDDNSEEQLADRLGVSARHLRRVFNEHLGVTPDRLARSHRTHFARRLLDDTDLPVSDVAFAAGFGSVRQFQRDCTSTFGAPPSELRARRPGNAHGISTGADGGLGIELPQRIGLEWGAMASWLDARTVRGVEAVTGLGDDPAAPTFRRTVDIDGQVGLIELHHSTGASRSRHQDPHPMVLTVHLPHWDGLIHVVRRARRMVATDLPLLAAVEHLGSDAVLGPLVSALPGLRPPGCWDPFETTIRAILAQQITVTGARTIAGRLAERLGTPVAGLEQHGLDRIFPRPDMFMEAALDDIGLTRSRTETLRTVAKAALDGFEFSGPDLAQRLVGLRGIGDWTAQYVALRAGEPDAFPASDIALREAAGRLMGMERPSTRELEELSQRWRPWRSIAAIHLWWSLRGA
jgi:AraC family transcriptional regulator of adaptative response / DNA-3-methyladenine glycosylase II